MVKSDQLAGPSSSEQLRWSEAIDFIYFASPRAPTSDRTVGRASERKGTGADERGEKKKKQGEEKGRGDK